MPISLLDLSAIHAAVSDFHRILEDPSPSNQIARRVFQWDYKRTTLGEQNPDAVLPAALIRSGVEWVLFHVGEHTRSDCPEITDSQLDLNTKAALLELRGELLPLFVSHNLATDKGLRVRFLVYLADILARIKPATLVTAPRTGNRQCEGENAQPGGSPSEIDTTTTAARSAKKSKKSTERGEVRLKLIAALTKHHEYAEASCLNLDPIGNNELARLAGVSESTASVFFKNQFKGHSKYQALCRNAGSLANALKMLNGEFSHTFSTGNSQLARTTATPNSHRSAFDHSASVTEHLQKILRRATACFSWHFLAMLRPFGISLPNTAPTVMRIALREPRPVDTATHDE